MSSIHEEHEKTSVSNKRIIIVFSIQVLLFLILIIRLFFLQIVNYDRYKQLSEDNRIKTFVIPPLRGHIYDRNNIKLTENQKKYRVQLYKNSENKNNSTEVISKLSEVLKLSNDDYLKVLKRLEKNKDQPIVPILDNVSWEDLVKIETNSYMLDGIMIENGYIRYYPYSTMFSHIIGYVNNPLKNEIDAEKNQKTKELLLHPDYKIGRTGLERLFNENIMGKNGFKKLEMNALSVPVREMYSENSTEGKDVTLTLDFHLQKFVEERMNGISGAVIVMNVMTGEVLSMVSTPSYDSNKFVEGISTDYWDELNNDPTKPLNNKCVSALYPPGSTFKLITAIAGIESGWDVNKQIMCEGKVALNKKRTLNCWKKTGHGILDMSDAIKNSCNIYFSRVGTFAGIDNIYKVATDFGLGEKYDIKLLNQKQGNIPNRDWKKKVFNDVWVSGDTVNTAIGQGFLTTTPLELVVMVSRIANGGYKVKPFITKDSSTADENLSLFSKEPMVKKETLDIVKYGMYRVVNEGGGTAYASRIKEPEYEMSGKTGTAQVIAKEKKDLMEEDNNDVEMKFRNHGLFVAFAPYKNPKYAIVVVVEHGGGGAAAAAPVAKDILYYAQKNNIGFDSSNLQTVISDLKK